MPAGGTGSTRTLSDVAREIRLRKPDGEAGSKPVSLTVAPATGGAAAKASPAESPAPTATPAFGSIPVIAVESAEHRNAVGSGGLVRIFGTVRNAGDVPACDVVVSTRLYDSRNEFLASGSGKIDEPVLRPGRRSSYSVHVQVPPEVAGSVRDKDLAPGITQGSVTLEGKWRMLGRAEAEVASVADSCPGETSPYASREAKPPPTETPTAPPR